MTDQDSMKSSTVSNQWDEVEWEEGASVPWDGHQAATIDNDNHGDNSGDSGDNDDNGNNDNNEIENNNKTSNSAFDDKAGFIVTVPMPEEKAKQVRPRWTKAEKEAALQMHKLHQLCYIGYGIAGSDLSDCEEIQAVVLSMVPHAVMEKRIAAKSFFSLLATKLRSQLEVVTTATHELSKEGILESIATRRVTHPYFVMYVALARIVARYLKLPPPRVILAFTPVSPSPGGYSVLPVTESPPLTRKGSRKKSISPDAKPNKPNRNNSSNDSNNNNNNSTNSDETSNNTRFGIWAEVFLSNDWTTIPLEDIPPGGPQYYIGFAPTYVVDVTRRYLPSAITPCPITQPIPLPQPPYDTHTHAKISNEVTEILDREDAILSVLANQQMPTNLAGFKSHPTYVLKQHLHKYEGIPPSTPIIAHFKGSPVYHRSHIQMMHTAEKWLQEGRQVRDKEQPCAFKNAKAKPSKSKSLGEEPSPPQSSGNEPNNAALFGEWQTEPYVPPTMENGIIPTNSFGNVYMYTPEMVPFGCTHLPYNGISKVAKSLGIAYAPAVVGWDYRKGQSYPTISGIVVAAEHAELLHTVFFDEMSMKEQEKADKEAQAKANEAKLEAKKRRIEEYVNSTYNQTDNDTNNTHHVDEAILPSDELTLPRDDTTNNTNDTPTKKHKITDRTPADAKRHKLASTTSTNATKHKGEVGLEHDHFHIFPEDGHTYDERRNTWYKTCSCGFSVSFEKM